MLRSRWTGPVLGASMLLMALPAVSVPMMPSAGGLWLGSLSFDDGTVLKLTGAVDDYGHGYFVDSRYTIYSATSPMLPDASGNLAATLSEFVPGSSAQQVGSAVFQGVVSTRSSISGSFSQTVPVAGNGAGSFTLSYLPAYAIPSSLSLLAGTWRFPVRKGNTLDTVTVRIDSSGSISGSSTAGCSYGGALSIVKSRYNAYELSLGVDCGAGAVQMHGLASYVPPASSSGGSTPAALVMEYDDGASQAVATTAALQ